MQVTYPKFTFQYGSILIFVIITKIEEPLIFTFQYGSILIAQAMSRKTFIKKIYIPIWFYFNLTYCNDFLGPFLIYIPIWFYFNQQN